MRCPECGFSNIEGADACAKCQTDLTDLSERTARDSIEFQIMKRRIAELGPVSPRQVSPETPLKDVIRILAKNGIGCVPITEADTLVGIFSERDLLRRVGDQYDRFQNRPIRDFMTLKPVFLQASDTVAFALHHMDVGDYRHIPICDGDRLTGIISVRDIMGFLVSHVRDG